MSKGEALSKHAPLFGMFLVEQDASGGVTQAEPGILISVDMGKGARYNRQMLLKHCRMKIWYRLDTRDSRLTKIRVTDFVKAVQALGVPQGGGDSKDTAYAGGAIAGTISSGRKWRDIMMSETPKAMGAAPKPLDIVAYEEDGSPITHPKNRAQMLRAPDIEKWKESEKLEMISNQTNKTVQMTNMSLSLIHI